MTSSLDAPAKGAATRAIVRYAREVARVPPIDASLLTLPSTMSRDAVQSMPHYLGINMAIPRHRVTNGPPTVLKAVATDKIAGEVLPRVNDTWLAMVPFDDLTRRTPDGVKRDLIEKRRGFLEILALVASGSSSPFRFDASCIISPVALQSTVNPFWFDLMSALDPEWKHDEPREMQRCLIALSHTQSLRFMLCVTQKVVPGDLPEMIERILNPSGNTTSTMSVNKALKACGVANTSAWCVTVELGISFSRASISPALLTKLLDVLDRFSHPIASPPGVVFRVTSLRFGRKCVFQPKALEVFGQRQLPSSIVNIRLGDLNGTRQASVQLGVCHLLKPHQGVQRLSLSTLDGFKAVASTLRNNESGVRELDLAFPTTAENAAWLAFSLFHVDSRSRVSSLRLRVPHTKDASGYKLMGLLTNEWLAAFKRALRSVTADRDLARLEGTEKQREDSARRIVTIKAGTPVKAEPYASAKLQRKIDNDTAEFEAIAAINDSVAVIVPGLGVGWVPSASVTSEHFVASRLATNSGRLKTNGRITSLAWDAAMKPHHMSRNEQHVNALLEMVETVGEHLLHLQLPSLLLKTTDLARIVGHCPKLVEVNVSGHAMTSIEPLVRAYAFGQCNIESLSIVRVGNAFRLDRFPQELQEILTGRHRSTLQRLAVHLTPLYCASELTTTEHLAETAQLTSVLESHDTLEFVQLPGSSLWENTKSDLERQLNAVGEPVPVDPVHMSVSVHPNVFCLPKLPMRHKLAFLSCVQNRHGSSALCGFDACILAQILRFCCRKVARQVIMDAPIALETYDARASLTDGVMIGPGL